MGFSNRSSERRPFPWKPCFGNLLHRISSAAARYPKDFSSQGRLKKVRDSKPGNLFARAPRLDSPSSFYDVFAGDEREVIYTLHTAADQREFYLYRLREFSFRPMNRGMQSNGPIPQSHAFRHMPISGAISGLGGGSGDFDCLVWPPGEG